MTFSTNSSSKAIIFPFALLVFLLGCTATNDSGAKVINDSAISEKNIRIAVFPISHISGTPAPVKDIRQSLVDAFKRTGLSILPEETLQRFIVNHRIRYVGGISRLTAQDLKWETGADAVLITTLELYSDRPPPKIALTSRLVSTGNNPTILWMDGVGLAGDDSIGLLELSLIEDPRKLLRNAVRHLSNSLADYLSDREDRTGSLEGSTRFWPRIYFRSPIVNLGTMHSVAVTPFLNLSERRSAGEIISHHFVRHLRKFETLSVIEPGVVRDALLKYRIVFDDGISNAQADILFNKLNVDLLLAGTIFDYQDYEGSTGTSKVDFSATLIERRSREVVWAATNHHKGDDGVFFFDWRRINTAHAMASEMVASTVETIVE